VDPDAYDLWLDPGTRDTRVVSDMLRPYDASQMRLYPVSTRINHTVNDDAECSKRVELVESQTQLFP
jgi:putative SOS response-associated peptidase YedK